MLSPGESPAGLPAGNVAKPALIPLERELQERLAWFIRLRWLAAAGILLGTWAMASLTLLNLSPWPLYGVGLAVSSYNAVFLLLYRRLRAGNAAPRTHRQSVYAQIALDWICLICLVHYSGGIQSPVVLAFIFHLIIGAILLPRWACYLQAALASLLMVVLLLVEHLGTWPPVVVADPRLTPLSGLLTDLWRWIVLTVLLGVTAFLTTSIIVPLRRKEQVLFRSERSLDQAYGEMETLYQVGQAVNATLDQEQVLGLIAENGARLMGMRACSIRLLDGSGRFLRVGAAYGLSRAYLDKGPVEVGKSRIDDEALAGRTVQIAQVGSDSRVQYPEEARQEGIHAMLCAPMQARGRSIGCIRVYSGEPHQFSRDEESFLLNLANLGAVAIENARAYTELQELSEERAWFARVTHHQLRAPLAAVRAMLDALRFAGPLNEKQVDFIGRSRRRTDELLEMIRDLLDLAAAQRPLAERPAEPVALLTSLERTLETLRARATHKGVALEIHLPAEIRVLAEAEDLERIFANLMDNAVKYTPTGGKVNLEVRQEGDQVVGRVRDTGIGIANEDQESVFRGFYRTQEAKATGELGTGIGLSIVKKLVTRWGGNLELESAAGQGSQFTVRLPATGGQTAAS